ncbi:MAG: glycosyltransferase [Bacteroidetes bacterium]|nr:MAG: glycosyltransferase [Bacteroidota bacterium]
MQKKILFIYTNFSTFVSTDFGILAEENIVTCYHFKPVKGLAKTAFQFIKQLFYLLFNIWKFDIVYIWFADYHSFLPVLFAKILGRKSFLVIGGYDVANIPELKYGSLSSPLRKKQTLFSIKNASLCIPVVENLEKKVNEIAPKAKTQTIYTGYKFGLNEEKLLLNEREKIILTVSITNNRQRFLIKGLDRFRELSENLPDFQFCVVGVAEDAKVLFDPLPENLVLVPPLNPEELTGYYLRASFYAQFSRSEGLPNALCEAMLYGCIPIGLDEGGISTAVDKTGLILNDWDVNSAIDFIQKNHNKLNREIFKNQIEEKFDLNFRKEKLLKLI